MQKSATKGSQADSAVNDIVGMTAGTEVGAGNVTVGKISVFSGLGARAKGVFVVTIFVCTTGGVSATLGLAQEIRIKQNTM
jgi:hypothetical protein